MSFKQDWLARSLRCPSCDGQELDRVDATWVCQSCGTSYGSERQSLNFITKQFQFDFKIEDNAVPSEHAYNPSAVELIEACRQIGGMALDCGAGSRKFVSEHLVQTEIMPYDNVDVLSVAQKLPFKDNVFDVVFSFDVLEHVNEPFASAAELARVLKPGGFLYIDLPFLQLEHGYPHHYFNATRMGLRRLFDPYLEIQAHVVPQSGHPAHVVWMALNTYRNGLKPEARADFESRTVGEIISASWKDLRDRPDGALSDAVKWKMASSTQAIFRKAAEGSTLSELDVVVSDLPNFRGRTSVIAS